MGLLKSPQQEVSSRYNDVTKVVTAYYALLKTLRRWSTAND